MKEVNVTVKGDTLTVLQGTVLEQKPPEKISITGDIKTVSNFLKVRLEHGKGTQEIDNAKAVILVDKKAHTIELQLDPENHYGATVKGALEISDELKAFGLTALQNFPGRIW